MSLYKHPTRQPGGYKIYIRIQTVS